jgi:hypothetical protein
MTTKTVISIGKALGNLIKVEDSSSDKLTFRSFLRMLVEIDVSIPLKEVETWFPLSKRWWW